VEVVRVWIVVANEAVSHGGEGAMVNPGRMWRIDLVVRRLHPRRETIPVLLRRGDLPPHEEEHDVENSHTLRNSREVWESLQDIREDL
jgi:hypothetical protein